MGMDINKIRDVFNSIEELKKDAASRKSSVEICYAIATVANDYDEYESIWENGTNPREVIKLARSLVSDDKVLYWGDMDVE